MVKRIHLILENDDFKQLKQDKDEMKITWETYITLLSYPEVKTVLKKIIESREARLQRELEEIQKPKGEKKK